LTQTLLEEHAAKLSAMQHLHSASDRRAILLILQATELCVLLFMTLAIVIFNFDPLRAIMIVMLALLNDGAVLSIA
jgi:hypothetical protein